MENALLRFYIDNKKHLPGIAFIVGISLLSGILKMLSATYWGRAVDYGIAGLVEEMLGCAVLMAAFILADCVRRFAQASRLPGAVQHRDFPHGVRQGF